MNQEESNAAIAEVIRLREALTKIKFLAEQRLEPEAVVEVCHRALDNKFVETFRLSL